MKYLGLDFGSKNIGVAISDINGKIALPLTTIKAFPIDEAIRSIDIITAENEIITIIVGLPKTLRGELSEQANLSLEFAERIKKDINKNVIMQDERLTSVQAEKLIGKQKKKNKEMGITDRISAAIILQNFLDRNDETQRR